MRIRCPFCGERGNGEFAYHGDASVWRPNDGAIPPLDAAARQRWHDYVYLRDNTAGPHRELWYHANGCRTWLVVTRNVVTHEIASVEPASDVALARRKAGHEA